MAVVAWLLAAMLGLGTHPRFLVHDSPREADMHNGWSLPPATVGARP